MVDGLKGTFPLICTLAGNSEVSSRKVGGHANTSIILAAQKAGASASATS